MSFQRSGTQSDRAKVSKESTMTTIFTKAILAAALALGALGAVSQANAASVDVDINLRHGHQRPGVIVRPPVHRPVVVVRPGVVVRPAVVIRPAVVVRPAPIVVRPAPIVVVQPTRCAPNLAIQKAFNNGVNHPVVSHVGANRVTVQGKSHGALVKMTFANVRGCPRL